MKEKTTKQESEVVDRKHQTLYTHLEFSSVSLSRLHTKGENAMQKDFHFYVTYALAK